MSLPAPFVAAGMTLDNTLGAAFLGTIGATFLFGITSLQIYLYYHHFRKDTPLHKVCVGILWTFDALHLATCLHAVYFYLVSHFGVFTIEAVWSLKLQVLLNIIIIVLVQSLYAYRVWRLSGYHRGILGYLAAAVVVGGFVIGVVLTYDVFRVNTFADVAKSAWVVYASFAAETTIDFILALAMCYYLHKSHGSEIRLNSRISRVMQYTLSSGLLTSACSLSCLFAYALSPNTFIYIGLQFLLTKLYIGSFLAMLNARRWADNYIPGDSQASGTYGLPSFVLSPSSRTAMGISPLSSTSERKYPWDADVENQPEPAITFSNPHHMSAN